MLDVPLSMLDRHLGAEAVVLLSFLTPFGGATAEWLGHYQTIGWEVLAYLESWPA